MGARPWAVGSAVALLLLGCGDTGVAVDGSSSGVSGTLTVFAAASLVDAFEELGAQLEDEHPGLDVQFSFAGSSTLAAQLEQGAPADVFASADETQMARVTDAGLAVDPQILAGNSLVLAFPPNNPGAIPNPPTAAGSPSLAEYIDEGTVLAVCARPASPGRPTRTRTTSAPSSRRSSSGRSTPGWSTTPTSRPRATASTSTASRRRTGRSTGTPSSR
jgi:molybdate transport system substrate-binding protein